VQFPKGLSAKAKQFAPKRFGYVGIPLSEETG
jgi:hypothetical protein